MPTRLVARTKTHRRLPVSVEAPRHARRILETVGELADYPDLRFAAQVLASELISNSVRHAGLGAGESVSLSVECDDGTLRVEVADAGPGFDALSVVAAHRRREERFRGVFLVNALADRWGYRRGDAVWFEIDLVPGRRPWRGRESISQRRSDGVEAAQ